MNKKAVLLCLSVLLIGVLSSSTKVRGFLFEAYDLVVYPQDFVIKDERFKVSGKWIVDKADSNGVTLREAGLVKDTDSLISIFPLQNDSDPCGKFGLDKDLNGKKVKFCNMEGEGKQNFQIYVWPDFKVLVLFSDEDKALSLINSLSSH